LYNCRTSATLQHALQTDFESNWHFCVDPERASARLNLVFLRWTCRSFRPRSVRAG
jgi:hypothetical protein